MVCVVGWGVVRVGVVQPVLVVFTELDAGDVLGVDMDTEGVEVAVQYPSEPQVAMDLQHSLAQQLSPWGQLPPAQHISVSEL